MTGKKEEKVKLLFELMKNARRSDRELAKALKISQPTVTRKRKMLEKDKLVREYTIIPDLEKIGYEFVALTFLAFTENARAFSKLITQLRQDWQPNLKDMQSFITSLARPKLFIKQFSFKYLEANR
jgi:DNA-binding Lrp family transcriptional regulator